MLPPALLDYTFSSASSLSRLPSSYNTLTCPKYFRRYLSHAAALALKTPTRKPSQELIFDGDKSGGSSLKRHGPHGRERYGGNGRAGRHVGGGTEGQESWASRSQDNGAALRVRSPGFPAKSISPVNKNGNAEENANKLSVELSRRIRDLEKVTDEVVSSLSLSSNRRILSTAVIIQEATEEYEIPTFSEQDLATFYEDILAHPISANPVDTDTDDTGTNPELTALTVRTISDEQYHTDLSVLEDVHRRLGFGIDSDGTGTTATGPLSHRVVGQLDHFLAELERKAQRIYQAMSVNSLSSTVTSLSSTVTSSTDESTYDGSSLLRLPVPLLSTSEWEALVRTGVHDQDAGVVEQVVGLMKRCNLPVPEYQLNALLQLYIEARDITMFEKCLEKFIDGSLPTSTQRHLHIKLHLSCTPQNIIPLSALDVLHAYETKGIPAPMKTYSKVIGRLFATGSSSHDDESLSLSDSPPLSFTKYTSPALAHAQAWDLFSHMRYVAHPNPDVFLYTQMIRACASPHTPNSSSKGSSDVDRALDLWYEMTVEKNLIPTRDSWDAVVLACARAGSASKGRTGLSKRREYVNEAFRLARQMLDSHRDAYGSPAYVPSKRTFCALLEGAKRVGDLGRARWILAEMVRGAGSGSVEVDEEVMMHIFHAYAAYKPPFKRSLARVVESQVKDEESGGTVDSQPSLSGSNDSSNPREPLQKGSTSIASNFNSYSAFSHVPPQTSAEVIVEVDMLFDRILRETRDSSSLSSKTAPSFSPPYSDVTNVLENKFTAVHLTTPLLNSYLSIYYAHASLDASINLKFSPLQSPKPNPRTYVEALERCTLAKKPERDLALKFGKDLLRRFETAFEGRGMVEPRMTERAHIAWIRLLAITNNVVEALSHIRAFVSKYPPSAVRHPSSASNLSTTRSISKPVFRSTRTSLIGARPLVRLTSPTDAVDAVYAEQSTPLASSYNAPNSQTSQIPPVLMWRDLEVLHHRIIAFSGLREKDLAYIKWICKSYEWALRMRRDEAIRPGVRAHPPRHPEGDILLEKKMTASRKEHIEEGADCDEYSL
ncbi:hypothetical protein F5878DRAFT_533821 [Lentinula raphanica]|uniref:Uncharacterized protein n=1 Tax=Lentinula raphanica TaxID=153919 RepID=A0AA38UFZ0_9AGAR|nr:hypothetical protein F5878DRAFT_533821 [Lentinula raphanica]